MYSLDIEDQRMNSLDSSAHEILALQLRDGILGIHIVHFHKTVVQSITLFATTNDSTLNLPKG